MNEPLLHYESVGPDAAKKVGLVLHGIMGSGRNFRGFARKLAEASQDSRFILVDLRHHGASFHPPGPHPLEAVAEDVFRLADSLGITRAALLGHSFGGKVAMVMARERPGRCAALFVLDSNPGYQHVVLEDPKDHEVLRVLDYLRRHPGPFPNKQQAAWVLMQDGLPERIARWIVLNLEARGTEYVWRLEPEAIRQMLGAYFEANLWPVLESKTEFPKHVVIGGQSDRHSTGNLERLRSGAAAGTIELHVLEKAGHWLHVDDPEGLLEILAPRI